MPTGKINLNEMLKNVLIFHSERRPLCTLFQDMQLFFIAEKNCYLMLFGKLKWNASGQQTNMLLQLRYSEGFFFFSAYLVSMPASDNQSYLIKPKAVNMTAIRLLNIMCFIHMCLILVVFFFCFCFLLFFFLISIHLIHNQL